MAAVIFAALILAGIGVVVALQPPTFTIERGLTMRASPAAIYPLIIDFHRWAQWSPWDQLDPTMKRTYGGPDSGVGASYAWQSLHHKVGEGRMEVTAVVPNASVDVRLEFVKPFASVNRVHLVLAAAAGGTHLTWTMIGNKSFVSKLGHLVMNTEKLIGHDLEKGLASIQALAEGEGSRRG